MKPSRLLLSTLVLSSGTVPFVQAQQPEAPVLDENVPIRYIRPMRNTVSVGVKLTGGGAKVKFQKLGTISRLLNTGNVNTVGSAVYDNGAIYRDLKGPSNVLGGADDAEGNPYVFVYKLKKNTDGTYNYDDAPSFESAAYDNTLPLVVQNGRIYPVVRLPKYQRTADGKIPQRPKLDANGNQVNDASGNPVFIKEFRPVVVNGEVQYEDLPLGDDLIFKDDRSRYWEIDKAEQFLRDTNGKIIGAHMDLFSSTAGSDEKSASSGSSLGVELGFEHVIRRPSLRFEWGFKGSVGFSTINAKDSGSVTATLIRSRQTYLVADPSMTINYKEDATAEEIAADPSIKYAFDSGTRLRRPLAKNYPDDSTSPLSEYTVPLLGTPVQNADGSWAVNTVDGNIDVRGNWQIKGATVGFRFGPSARFYFSPRFSISGTAGFSAVYYSTRYNINEAFTIPGGTREVTFTTEQAGPDGQNRLDNTKKGVKIGAAGEVNVEWWLTPSTGFYVGAAYESPGSYTQRMGDHEAKVDLGSGTAIRFGISTRF